jgi:hypothetical protein
LYEPLPDHVAHDPREAETVTVVKPEVGSGLKQQQRADALGSTIKVASMR